MTEREAVAELLSDTDDIYEWNRMCDCMDENCERMPRDHKWFWRAEAKTFIAALTALGWQKVGPDQVVVPRAFMEDPDVKLFANHHKFRAMIEARPK